jgi:hypothetical protein
MAFKIAELEVEVVAATAGLDTSLAGVRKNLQAASVLSRVQAAKDAAAAVAAAKSAAAQIQQAQAAKGAGVSGFVGGFAAAAALEFGRAAAGAFVEGVKGAMNLNESIQKTQVVFGGASKSVFAFSEAMQSAFGSSRQEILDASSSFGLIAKGAGLSKAAAAGMSVSLAKLADDASSFYNVPLDVALQKIQAGLVGQSRPLREFGVLLDEASVKAEAVRMGLALVGRELTSSQKVTARASLIEKGLADAQGDHLRTQGQLANQCREFTGRLENLGMTIGGIALPALTGLTQALNFQLQGFTRLIEKSKEYHETLVVALGGGVKGTLLAPDKAAWAASFGGPKMSEAAMERAAVEAARSDRAKAAAAKEIDKPAEDAALGKAREEAYKSKRLADMDARRERFSETTPGRVPLSMAIRGKGKEEAEIITRGYHAEADAAHAGLERLKSIAAEKINLGFRLVAAAKQSGGALAAATATAALGADPKTSVRAAQAELDKNWKDQQAEKKRNFQPQFLGSARELDRLITSTAASPGKPKLSDDELKEIKKNSDAQLKELKDCAASLKALVTSGTAAIFAR